MSLDSEIEIVVLLGAYSRVENASYALIVNHKSKTYVRVDVMNKNITALLQVFNVPVSVNTLQKFKDVKEFKVKYPKYK